MKTNVLLIPFFVALSMFLVSFASAANLASAIDTRFNDLSLGSGVTVAGMVGEVVPVKVYFTAAMDMEDVKVEVRMEGTRDEVSASTSRFNVVSGSTYSKLLSLKLPSDSKDLSKDYTLYVEITSASDRTEVTYALRLQRDSYTLDILSIDYSSKVSAGDVLPVSVVAKDNGFNDANDVYVVASIPSLGISSRGYMGDLVSQQDKNNGEEDQDSALRTVYLKFPENTASGVYEMEISVYNQDSQTSIKKLVSVGTSGSSMTLATDKSKDLKAGETVTYEMTIVNSGNSMKVFNIEAVSTEALKVSVPTAVAVGPASTQKIPIMVSASKDTAVGAYTFSVNVDGTQTVFGANVTSGNVSVSLVAWTVVLVVVFIVLLAVLLVLVTRKEKPVEEVETSYY